MVWRTKQIHKRIWLSIAFTVIPVLYMSLQILPTIDPSSAQYWPAEAGKPAKL